MEDFTEKLFCGWRRNRWIENLKKNHLKINLQIITSIYNSNAYKGVRY